MKARQWPEKIRLTVLRPLERSFHSWFPADFWLREAGGIPSQVPSLGGAYHKSSDGGNDAVQESVTHQEPYIDIVIVATKTSAPNEWTPREIYEALKSGTLRFSAPGAWQEALVAEGKVQSSPRGATQLVEPIRRISRKEYDAGNDVARTPEGMRRANEVYEVSDFTRMGAR
jgi:hypothetical protein